MKSSNDVSVVALVTSVVALTTYGVVIWRARVVAQRMEEDVSNIWVGNGKPMVIDSVVLPLFTSCNSHG